MEFRILGPLAVSESGTAIPVRGRICQHLLAVLLIDAGRGVSMARLVDAIWNGSPPATALRQVRHAAARLRKVLAEDRVESAGDGYRISMAGATLDSRQFELAVRKSRELTDAGNRSEAAATLRFGLELWRGSAFTGLSGRIVEAAAARLEESRLVAVENRIQLETDGGTAQDVIGELRQLLSDNPYRQRLTGLLMFALHREGRTPEALEEYERLRRRLSDDLGLDPNPELRERQAAILRGDRHPTAVAASASTILDNRRLAVSPSGSVPAQLPIRPRKFVGRATQLATLDKLQSDKDEPAACILTGPPGTGKTALAIHWGHQVRDRFPDGQLFINLRGFDRGEPATAHEALGRAIRALRYSRASVPEDVDEASALYRSLLSGKRVLVILDNARDAVQVRALLPADDGCFTVVTSRNRLPGLTASHGVEPVGLAPLARRDSVELLSVSLGGERLRTESVAADELSRLCGDLPLALRIAAANLAARPHTSLNAYVVALEDKNRLDMLAVDGDPGAAVASTFGHSYRALESDTRQLFVRLGLIPGEHFSDSLAGEVAGFSDAATRIHLNRLRTAHLLEQHRPGRYRLHDLVRLYAVQQAEHTLDETERSAVIERYIAWHNQRILTLPLAETVNLIAAIPTLRDHPKVWHLAMGLQAVVYAGQVPTQTRQLIEAGLRQAQRHDDRRGRSQMTGLLGAWYCSMGEVEPALVHGRRAMVLSRGQDLETRGLARGNLGLTLLQYGSFHEAESLLLEALRIADEINSAVWQQATDYYLGILYGQMGEFGKAFHYLAEADVLSGRQPTTGALTINRLARARLLVDTERFDEADSEVKDMERYIHDAPDNRARCLYLSIVADLSRHFGDGAGAVRSLEEMRAVARRYGLSFLEADAVSGLAIALSETGDHEAALTSLEPLLNSGEQGLGPRIDAEIALAAAVANNGIGAYTAALEHGTRAVDAFADMPNPLKHGRCLLAVADAHQGLGDLDAARRCRAAADAILTRTG